MILKSCIGKPLAIAFAWCAAISMVGAQADRLSDAEREALLKRLDELRETSDSRFETRFRNAVQAFRGAMVSDEAAFALYLNSVEKIDFTDKNRRGSEFREWRRKNDERLKDSAFRRALRHQLRWLVLTLQASSEDADRAQLATSAQEIIDSIVGDAVNLNGHQNVLEQSVLGSFYARAYSLSDLPLDDWVLAPGRIGQIYQQIIMPRYREVRRADSLQSLWQKRIQQEIRLAEVWRFGVRDGQAVAQPVGQGDAQHERFMREDVPRMQWQMEVDLFKHGDPAGAANRMLALLERNMTHPSASDWLGELQELLASGKPSDGLAVADAPVAGSDSGAGVSDPVSSEVGYEDPGAIFDE